MRTTCEPRVNRLRARKFRGGGSFEVANGKRKDCEGESSLKTQMRGEYCLKGVRRETNWSRKEGNFGTSLKHIWHLFKMREGEDCKLLGERFWFTA